MFFGPTSRFAVGRRPFHKPQLRAAEELFPAWLGVSLLACLDVEFQLSVHFSIVESIPHDGSALAGGAALGPPNLLNKITDVEVH